MSYGLIFVSVPEIWAFLEVPSGKADKLVFVHLYVADVFFRILVKRIELTSLTIAHILAS